MIKLLLCCAGIFCCLFLSAQTPQRINSGELIEKANQLHNDGKYKEAVRMYGQVPRNDTNYVKSLYEIILTQVEDTAYTDALRTCEKALALQHPDYEKQLLQLYGGILDEIGESARAHRIYDSALQKYPHNNDLWFNKGVAFMRQEKISEASEIFKTILLKDPYYASAHYRLAQCAAQQGQMVPAMYSALTYLLISPSGKHFSNAISLLDQVAKGSDNIMSYVNKHTPDAAFASAQKIVLSKIALDKAYKVQADIDEPIVRQLQVMFEKVQYQPGRNNFWMEYYVPLYADIWSKKQFEPAVFYAFSNVDLDPIQRYNKKNSGAIKSLANNAAEYFNTIRATRELNFSKRAAAPILYHFDKGILAGKGKMDARETLTGDWEFYYDNGNLKSVGRFNAAGEKEGTWKYYYADGKLVGYDSWQNGQQTGEDVIYNRNGIVTSRAVYKNNQLHGQKHTYNASGNLFTTTEYQDGKETGLQIRYYNNGRKKIEAVAKDDKLDGAYKSYYQNGQPEVIASYVNGKLNGTYQSYHENGQLSFTAQYKDGLLQGTVTAYHPNGKIKSTKNFVDDAIQGPELTYNSQGVLVQKINYEKGKAQGLAEYYDNDGKLYSTFEFDKDILKVARYFDKSGNQISRSEKQRGQWQLTVFNPQGLKVSVIPFNDAGERINSDTYYYTSGKIKETNQYKKGKLDGISTGYHPNGTKSFEIRYSNDEKNGLLVNYHFNGAIKSYGWYDADLLNDDWVTFNEKGKISSRTTYLNDEVVGVKESYFPDGRLDDEEEYENGLLKALHQYDTLGRKMHTSLFKNGSGTLKYVHFNGNTRIEGAYVQGEYDGVFKSYFFDGKLSYVKTYEKGLLQGDYTEYFHNGQVALAGKYKDGQPWGTWKYFTADGKLWKEEPYVNGLKEGKVTYYYPSGKVDREIEFVEGEYHGTFKRFAEDGQLAYIFYYKRDEITGYTYADKNGSLLPVKDLPGGNGKIKTFYSNGELSAEMEYEAGSLIGDYKLYFPNGKLFYTTQETYSQTHGMLKEYYANGNLRKEYPYYWNNEDGYYKEYHENGKLKEEGYYYNGYLHGIVKEYNADGKLVQTKQYHYGTLLNIKK